MNSNLHVKTKCKHDDDEQQQQPLSPTAEYFSSNALSVCIIAILEFEVPMDLVRLVPLVHDVFLPINPRFSSIMVISLQPIYGMFSSAYVHFSSV